MKKLLSLFALSYLLSSCMAYHHGSMNHAGYPNPNYHKSNQVLVQVHTTRVLGFGGLGTDAMLLEAKRELERVHPLRPGESFINHTYDYKHTFFLFGDRTTLSLSADVIIDHQSSGFSLEGEDYLDERYLRNGDIVYMLYPQSNQARTAVVVDYQYDKVANTIDFDYYWPEERPKVRGITLPLRSIFFSQMTLAETRKAGFNIDELVYHKGQAYIVKGFRRGTALLINEAGEQLIVGQNEIETLQP